MEDQVPSKKKLEWPGLPNNILLDIYVIAKRIGIKNIAIVGGAVRDELINNSQASSRNNPKDLDLVVEGSATYLAKALVSQLGPERVKDLHLHSAFETANMKIDCFPVDLATARLEKYQAPGLNPEVTPCSLKEDLVRRDFSINAMAIELSSMRLLDPYFGKNALTKKEIEFLHPKSVEEDPTRIIRAARYCSRLLFDLTPDALNQIQSTLSDWPWDLNSEEDNLHAPPALATRLRFELELLFLQEPWKIAIANLQRWGGLLLLDKELQKDKYWKRRLIWASRLKLNLLTAFLIGAEKPSSLAARLQLPKTQQILINQHLEIKEFLNALNETKECLTWPPSKWANELEAKNWHPEAIALSICDCGIWWRPLHRWWNQWRFIKSPISAKQLIKSGWIPGESLGRELKRLREKELDKDI